MGTVLKDFLKTYKKRIDFELESFCNKMNERSRLVDCCRYALTNGGKRIRPCLVLTIAEALSKNLNVFPVALSVEFFHTASLLADDLPCMDNDSLRRGKPTSHLVFGEDVALLASYALIGAGYTQIIENKNVLKKESSFSEAYINEISLKSFEIVANNTGFNGAPMGQFYDIHPPGFTTKDLKKILYLKTVTLFEISFMFGWLFGGGSPDLLADVKQASYHYGMCFQLVDDLLDMNKDKNRKDSSNCAVVFGLEKTIELFEKEYESLEKILVKLKLCSDKMSFLLSCLKEKVFTKMTLR